MTGSRRKLLLLGLAALTLVNGCCTYRRRAARQVVPAPAAPCPSCNIQPPYMNRLTPGGTPPAAMIDPATPAVPALPPGPAVPANPDPLPPPADGRSFRWGPPSAPAEPLPDVQEQQGGATLEPPRALSTPPSGDPPLNIKPPVDITPPQPVTPRKETPRVPEVVPETPPDTPSPVAIPQFALVEEGIATGRKPFLDGVEWLKAKGYKTILHLRAPGADDSGHERMFTQAGFIYKSLEVAPNTLTRKTLQAFYRIVQDPANRPLFVYDDQGYLTGGLWYLYLRDHAGAAMDEARRKAELFGLSPDQDADHTAMWNAVRQLDAR